MGSLFDKGGGLTNPGSLITDSNGQSAVGKPSDVLNSADSALRAKTQGQELNTVLGQGAGGPAANAQLPTIGTPSLQQAAKSGAQPGGENVMSPGLNKAGKLVTLLQGGLQGAMAGRAKSEETVAATGGRRSGGAGMGFEAGYELPWQRAGMQNQLEQQQAQTQLLKAQSDMVQTPYGMMPAGIARFILPAEIRASASKDVQGLRNEGGLDKQTLANQGGVEKQTLANTGRTGAAQISGNTRIEATKLGLGPLAQVPRDLQDQLGLPPELPLRMLNQAETAANKPLTIVQGENGPAIVNKQQAGKGVGGTPKSLGLGSPSLGRAVQVADPNNPGNTTYSTAGQAIKSGAAGPQSASVQVPKKAMASEVPTKIGDQKVNFTTMIQHAQLLREAAKALNNGDVQTLSGLRNAFKNEFGYSGPITAQAIADAYSGEVTNVIAKGHITDAEMKKTGHTIDLQKQNFATVDSVLNAYQALAQSKMSMLDKQEKAAVDKSQPKNNAPKSGGSSDLVNQLIQKHAPTASAAAKQ